jgi:hypothetical protein
MRRHSLPVGVAQLVAASIELAQRPRLGVFRAAAGDRLPVLVAANDPLIRHSLFSALGARGVAAAGSIARIRVQPDTRFDTAVAAVEIPSFAARRFAAAGWLVLPRWIAMEVDLERPETAIWDARKRETVRRIERSGLRLEIARGSQAAREFHQRMYAPTAARRHVRAAIVLRLGHLEAAMRGGWLLYIDSGSRRMAGLLVATRPGPERVLDALLFGVASGDYAETKLAREAAYLFALRWARDEYGASRMGLTAAAPFVRDGILRFKKRWGATAVADLRQASCIAVRVARGSPALSRALAEHPPVALRFAAGGPSLCAVVVRDRGAGVRAVPATPGIDVDELEARSPADLPGLVETWARSAGGH